MVAPASLLERAVRQVGPEAALALLTADERAAAPYIWPLMARPNQLAPDGDWSVWLVLAGRGFGKTRTGGEWVRTQSEHSERMALVAPTAADARDVMVEGESGIMAICPTWNRPKYEPSKRRLTWPNGSMATVYSADEPDRLRGPQHAAAWCDELASWAYPDEAWANLQMGLRLGNNPRTVVTTTPRPIQILREMLTDERTAVTRGSSYDNRANLPQQFINEIIRRYEGTRLGRQELYAEILDDVEGALWRYGWIANARVAEHPPLVRVVVAIDPAVTHGPDADETGIAVAGLGEDGDFYVLHGAGYRETPDGWAREALRLYDHHEADVMLGERNNGGEMVEATVRNLRPNVNLRTVHASRGKRVRAEPVAALYEQGRVHHVGIHQTLEDQQIAFTGATTDADDQVDALVYAVSELSTPRRRYSYGVHSVG